MKISIWSRLDILTRNMTPLLLTFALLILSSVQTYINNFSAVMPMLVLMSIYYWAIYCPHLMPIWLVFIIGIIQDLMSGSLVGMQAFILLTIFGFVLRQRRFFHGKNFGVVWWGFMLVGIFAAILQWVFIIIIQQTWVSPSPVFFSYLISVAIFPILAIIMIAIHRTLPLND